VEGLVVTAVVVSPVAAEDITEVDTTSAAEIGVEAPGAVAAEEAEITVSVVIAELTLVYVAEISAAESEEAVTRATDENDADAVPVEKSGAVV